MTINANLLSTDCEKKVLVHYLACFDFESSIGILNKVNQTVDAFNANGYIAEKKFIPLRGWGSHVKLFYELLISNADIFIIRNNLSMPLLFPLLIWKRLKHKVIIIDLPTPNATLLYELKLRNMSLIGKIVRGSMIVVFFPWVFYPANRVLQYAPESRYFKFGINRKSKLVGNGINVSAIALRKPIGLSSPDPFTIIGVGSLNLWHGFDRVLKSIANYHLCGSKKIKFIIVGDGSASEYLQQLVVDLSIENHVEFVGFKTGYELDALFDRAHVAVSSLGLFRKKLEWASDLKSREYTARGMPFISAGFDVDFFPHPDFVFKVDNSNAIIKINEVIEWYMDLESKNMLGENIRKYAVERLDYKNKVEEMMLFSNGN